MAGLFLIHWIHILAAATWFGGIVLATFVIMPGILQLPAAEARKQFQATQGRIVRVMSIAGPTTILLGIVRGTFFGPIDAWRDLWSTSYGHWFSAAIVLTIITGAQGERTGRQWEARVWDRDQYRTGGAEYVRRSGITTMVLLAAVVGCMVAMRFGL